VTVAHHGTGCDPGVVDRYVDDEHIGLASLMVRFDAMGGSTELSSVVGVVGHGMPRQRA
jgi:two-component system NarL family sensor kinase